MTTTKGQTTTQPYTTDSTWGTVIPFDQVNEPGCYICNWDGHLLRIPKDAVARGRSPLVNMIGLDPLFVTKISENPFIPVSKARLLAANFDLLVDF